MKLWLDHKYIYYSLKDDRLITCRNRIGKIFPSYKYIGLL